MKAGERVVTDGRELGGKPHVLAAPSDGQRKLLVRHDDLDALFIFVEHDLRRFPAGARAFTTNVAMSGDHGMMSIFSPCNSFTTACTREPRMPTQAPTGSTEESREMTAILAREPGSRATALTSTMPS